MKPTQIHPDTHQTFLRHPLDLPRYQEMPTEDNRRQQTPPDILKQHLSVSCGFWGCLFVSVDVCCCSMHIAHASLITFPSEWDINQLSSHNISTPFITILLHPQALQTCCFSYFNEGLFVGCWKRLEYLCDKMDISGCINVRLLAITLHKELLETLNFIKNTEPVQWCLTLQNSIQ